MIVPSKYLRPDIKRIGFSGEKIVQPRHGYGREIFFGTLKHFVTFRLVANMFPERSSFDAGTFSCYQFIRRFLMKRVQTMKEIYGETSDLSSKQWRKSTLDEVPNETKNRTKPEVILLVISFTKALMCKFCVITAIFMCYTVYCVHNDFICFSFIYV